MPSSRHSGASIAPAPSHCQDAEVSRPGDSETLPPRRSGAVFAVPLALAAVFLPLLLAIVAPDFLASSYGQPTVAFELFGFCAAVALAAVAADRWRRSPDVSWQERCISAAPLAVGLAYAYLIGEYSNKPFDYDCYEYAARALQSNQDPYRFGLNYLYPPLTAQAFAGLHAALQSILAPWGPDPEQIWRWIFYGYQCTQLGLILLAFELLVRFGRGLGLSASTATVVVTVLLLFDNPLLRTLRHGQINLWVLDLSLLTLLWARRYPAAAGFALALATQIKIYPAILGLSLLFTGCWRALIWGGVSSLLLVGLGTRGFTDWTVWAWFVDFYTTAYPGEVAFRNNSFHSLAHNALHLVLGLPRARTASLARPAATLFAASAAAWLILRAWRHSGGTRDRSDAKRLAIGADALAFSLLISQSVWEHHYLFVLPLLLLVLAAGRPPGRERTLALAALMTIGLPTIDLFPISHHRMLGLLIALVATAPRSVEPPDTTRGVPAAEPK